MSYTFSLFSLIFFAGGLITGVLAAIIWQRRPAPGIIPITLYLLAISLWLLSTAFESGGTELGSKFLWTRIQYLAVCSCGVLWLFFAYEFSGNNLLRRFPVYILVCLVPAISVALVWTNPSHGLIWTHIHMTLGTLGYTSIMELGPLYLIIPLHQYVLVIWGIVILARYILYKPRLFRIQLILFITGTSVPILGSILYLFDITFIQYFDITAFCAFLSSIFFAIAILLFHFLEVIPVAYRALVNSIPEGIIILDANNYIIELNPAAVNILNENKAKLIWKRLGDAWPQLSEILSQSQNGVTSEISTDVSGSRVILDVSRVILKDSRNRLEGKLIVLRNVTMLENALSSEQKLRVSLEEEIKKRSTYSNAVVHELRTPLTAIKLSGDLLEEQVQEKIQVSLVQNIKRATHNLEQRVNELFELARGESGMIKISPESLDLVKLIFNIVDEMTPAAVEHGLTLRAEPYQPVTLIYADESRIRQVLMNLISNSLKYTKTGGITIKTSPYDDNFLLVRVEDTGSGMDQEQVSTLFDPYSRKQTSGGGTTGLGIGLTLSKMFVELHGGEIRAESTPGQGTVISFTLPRAG